MSKLIDFIKAEHQPLMEKWDNFQMLSPEIRKYIGKYINTYGGENMGKDAKVELVPYARASEVIHDLFSHQCYGFVLLYNGDDIAFFEAPRSSYSNEPDILYSQTYKLFYVKAGFNISIPNVKSETGTQKIVNTMIKNIIEYEQENPENANKKPAALKKEVIAKVYFQEILFDPNRATIHSNRKHNMDIQTFGDNYIEKDGQKSIPNSYMGKDKISQRLKQYIENKLPNITDLKNLPDLNALLSKDFQFKLFGHTYKYEDTYGDMDILLGKSTFTWRNDIPAIVFEDTGEPTDNMPHFITFYLMLDKLTLKISKIGLDYHNDGHGKTLDDHLKLHDIIK